VFLHCYFIQPNYMQPDFSFQSNRVLIGGTPYFTVHTPAYFSCILTRYEIPRSITESGVVHRSGVMKQGILYLHINRFDLFIGDGPTSST